MSVPNITTAPRKPNRRVTRFTKVVTMLILAPFLIAGMAGAGIGITHALQAPRMPLHGPQGASQDCLALATADGFAPEVCEGITLKESVQVADYNDGFGTSKQDDCQQGFAPACQWLKTNR